VRKSEEERERERGEEMVAAEEENWWKLGGAGKFMTVILHDTSSCVPYTLTAII